MVRIHWLTLLCCLALVTGCPSEDDDDTSADDDTGGDDDTGDDDSATDDDDDTGPSLSYSGDIAPVFQSRCSPCHTESAQGGLSLVDGHAALVSVPAVQLPEMNRVEPGDAQGSYLMHKLQGTQADVGGSGDPMPLDTEPLNGQVMDAITAWITGGAQP